MTRKVTLTIDRSYGSWPIRAATEVAGVPETIHAPAGVLIAGGPTEEYAVENLKRIVTEWVTVGVEPPGQYPKVIEVDW